MNSRSSPAPVAPTFARLAFLACLALLTLLPLPTVTAATHAAPAAHPSTARAGRWSRRGVSKVTLADTSPTGPALWTINGAPSTSTYNAVLAWTGTDSAHHINIRTSDDGQHFGTKVTLNETAISSPAVAVVLVSPSAPRILVLAWTGTNPNHSLNVLFDVFNVTGHRSKRVLADQSIAGPALATNRGLAFENLQLAWTGVDPNHSLNVRELDETTNGSGDVTGLTLGPKRTLPMRLNSFDGPGLTANIFQDQSTILITWAQSSGSLLSLADVSSPSPSPFVFFSSQTTAARPSLLALTSIQGGTPAQHFWWSWTGTNLQHSLNLMDTADFMHWPGPVTTFAETATGGPALGSVGVANQLLLAWTGTDRAHHLNIAIIGV